MTRQKSFMTRMSEYEYEQLKQEAARQGVSMADVVRRLIATLPRPTGA